MHADANVWTIEKETHQDSSMVSSTMKLSIEGKALRLEMSHLISSNKVNKVNPDHLLRVSNVGVNALTVFSTLGVRKGKRGVRLW